MNNMYALSTHLQRGHRYLSLGRFEQALREFNAALAIVPESIPALEGRADAYRGMGDTESADRDLAAIENVKPVVQRSDGRGDPWRDDPRGPLLSFAGRWNREQYIFITVTAAATFFVARIVAAMMFYSTLSYDEALGIALLSDFLMFAFWNFATAVWAVKRLHDLDRASVHFWLLLVPIYGQYLALVMLFKRGTVGPNRFGPDPIAFAKTHTLG